MLEERLSSAYSQQTLGYGATSGAPQYSNMSGLPTQATETRTGAENFYYGNPPDIARPQPTVYAAPQMNNAGYEPPDGSSTAYPPQGQRGPPTSDSHHNAWNPSPYPSLGSPPPSNSTSTSHATPGPSGPAQYYTSQPDQDPSNPQFQEAPYQPSPIMRRDSQYQPNAPPSMTEPQLPEQVQSPRYSTGPPTGSAHYPQANGPPPQSYYYQPQQAGTAPSAYPQLMTGQPGNYPETGQSQTPATHQAPRPVEESLIEL